MTKGKYKLKKLRASQQSGSSTQPVPGKYSTENDKGAMPKTTDGRLDWKSRADKVQVWLRSALWGLLCYVIGVISGPLIQQRFLALLPGPKTDVFLRAEIMTQAGKPNCHFYMFSLYNFQSIDYLHAKVQFPDPITAFKIGITSETVVNDDDRQRGLQWGKGWDPQDKCAIMGDSLSPIPGIQSSANGHIIELQTSKLPDPTHIVGLIATTADLDSVRSTLWTEGEFEYPKFGQTIRKKLPIQLYIPPGAQ